MFGGACHSSEFHNVHKGPQEKAGGESYVPWRKKSGRVLFVYAVCILLWTWMDLDRLIFGRFVLSVVVHELLFFMNILIC